MNAIIGLDIGRRNTKVISKGYSDIFTTTATIRNNKFDSNNTIIVNNTKYVVGLGNGNTIYNDNKARDDVFEICMLYALSKFHENEFNIVTGLPINHWKLYKDDIESKYTGTEYDIITSNGENKIITINNIKVMPEGILCVNDEDEEDTIIIDIGGLTVDVALYKDLKLINANSYELGVRKMYSSIAEELNKTLGTDYEVDDIERYIEKEHIIYDNKIHDYDFTQYKINFLQKIITCIKEDFGWKKCIKRFVGGGSIVFEDILSSKNLNVHKLAILENAMAFYEKGVSIYG